jgi:hypothetical protein
MECEASGENIKEFSATNLPKKVFLPQGGANNGIFQQRFIPADEGSAAYRHPDNVVYRR